MDSVYKMFAENNEQAFDLDRDISQHLLIPLVKYYDRYNQLGLNVITVEYSNDKIRIYQTTKELAKLLALFLIEKLTVK